MQLYGLHVVNVGITSTVSQKTHVSTYRVWVSHQPSARKHMFLHTEYEYHINRQPENTCFYIQSMSITSTVSQKTLVSTNRVWVSHQPSARKHMFLHTEYEYHINRQPENTCFYKQSMSITSTVSQKTHVSTYRVWVSHQPSARKHMFLQTEYVLNISFNRLKNTIISQWTENDLTYTWLTRIILGI